MGIAHLLCLKVHCAFPMWPFQVELHSHVLHSLLLILYVTAYTIKTTSILCASLPPSHTLRYCIHNKDNFNLLCFTPSFSYSTLLHTQ